MSKVYFGSIVECEDKIGYKESVMSKSKSELKSEFVKKCISEDEANGYVYSDSAKEGYRKEFEEAQLAQIKLNNRQQEANIEFQKLSNTARDKDILLSKIEHARRNIDVLIKLRIESPDHPISSLKKEVLDALKVNIEILNEVKNIK